MRADDVGRSQRLQACAVHASPSRLGMMQKWRSIEIADLIANFVE